MCDQTCHWCFQNWMKWWKAREGQMRLVTTTAKTSKVKNSVSFADAALTSVKPPR